MATPKKSATKKPAAKKPTTKAARATVAPKKSATKSPAQRVASKKKTTKGVSHRLVAFNIVPDDQPFMTFRLTTQTIYWLIFAVTILALGIWVLRLNLQILALYDQIDQTNAAAMQMEPTAKKTVKH